MAKLADLVVYLNDLLQVRDFSDYCPNGLQVEGRAEVHTLVTGVTASLALLESAIAMEADAVLVHHGYFWKGEDPKIIGMKHRRLRALLVSDMSLLAYHLPLDAHATLGNNAELARLLGITERGRFGRNNPPIACWGELSQPMSPDDFARHLAAQLGRAPLVVAGGHHPIQRLGWCTGAAQSYLDDAGALGLDAFVSGEVSEYTVHSARELGIHYFAAGHHATERYGVQALGAHLAERFGIRHQFIDIDNPV